MLDRDLAAPYGVEIKVLNRAVRGISNDSKSQRDRLPSALSEEVSFPDVLYIKRITKPAL